MQLSDNSRFPTPTTCKNLMESKKSKKSQLYHCKPHRNKKTSPKNYLITIGRQSENTTQPETTSISGKSKENFRKFTEKYREVEKIVPHEQEC